MDNLNDSMLIEESEEDSNSVNNNNQIDNNQQTERTFNLSNNEYGNSIFKTPNSSQVVTDPDLKTVESVNQTKSKINKSNIADTYKISFPVQDPRESMKYATNSSKFKESLNKKQQKLINNLNDGQLSEDTQRGLINQKTSDDGNYSNMNLTKKPEFINLSLTDILESDLDKDDNEISELNLKKSNFNQFSKKISYQGNDKNQFANEDDADQIEKELTAKSCLACKFF